MLLVIIKGKSAHAKTKSLLMKEDILE